jgi:hypothetical protein
LIKSKYFFVYLQFLLHLEALKDNSLIAVERTLLSVTEALPPTLKEKKFGT